MGDEHLTETLDPLLAGGSLLGQRFEGFLGHRLDEGLGADFQSSGESPAGGQGQD